jgi:uncharacterized YigZ family protein
MVSADRYRTLVDRSEGIYREKASKFIGIAFPIESEAAFKSTFATIRRDHFSARHACFAWILGYAGERHKANDDGEPSGTAGKPILRQLQAASLMNTAIVVVRYFGGTLLGKAGLIHAYGDAARLAIASGTIVERIMTTPLAITCGYDLVERIRKEAIASGCTITGSDFAERCHLYMEVPRAELATLTTAWQRCGAEVVHAK